MRTGTFVGLLLALLGGGLIGAVVEPFWLVCVLAFAWGTLSGVIGGRIDA